MASVRRQLVKTPLGWVTYIWLEGGVVPYEVLMADIYEQATPDVTFSPISLASERNSVYKFCSE